MEDGDVTLLVTEIHVIKVSEPVVAEFAAAYINGENTTVTPEGTGIYDGELETRVSAEVVYPGAKAK